MCSIRLPNAGEPLPRAPEGTRFPNGRAVAGIGQETGAVAVGFFLLKASPEWPQGNFASPGSDLFRAVISDTPFGGLTSRPEAAALFSPPSSFRKLVRGGSYGGGF